MVTNYFAVDQIKVDSWSTRANLSRFQITNKNVYLIKKRNCIITLMSDKTQKIITD
jgi:hypothetical protein